MGLLRLECPAQQYAWGKVGLKSTVAQLVQAGGGTVEADKPYAELWMGTHPNGPAEVVLEDGSKRLLNEYLIEHPNLISNDASEQESVKKDGLPYLFKILSVHTALSIQSHPDKSLAEKLHAGRPDVYKDPNHKPEMACAITEFEALAGFLPVAEAIAHVKKTPELEELLSASAESKALLENDAEQGEEVEKAQLKVLFSDLMTCEPELVSELVSKLQKRLEAQEDDLVMPDKLALRLSRQYPGDVGVFCAYFMCYRVLQPGQAVFLGANEPHAYLAGDCAEIMACSDNVVRAGLTPKLRDTETLISSLTYRQPSHTGAEFHPGNMLEGKVGEGGALVYSPPDPAVTEFQMERIAVKKTVDLKTADFACILLVLQGEGTADSTYADGVKKSKQAATPVKRGDIFLVPAGTKVSLTSTGDSLIAFRASKKAAF
jgi:mannose-6-phosphate isomerase